MSNQVRSIKDLEGMEMLEHPRLITVQFAHIDPFSRREQDPLVHITTARGKDQHTSYYVTRCRKVLEYPDQATWPLTSYRLCQVCARQYDHSFEYVQMQMRLESEAWQRKRAIEENLREVEYNWRALGRQIERMVLDEARAHSDWTVQITLGELLNLIGESRHNNPDNKIKALEAEIERLGKIIDSCGAA